MTEYAFVGTKWGNPTLGSASGVITWSFASQSWSGGYSFDDFITNPAFQAAVEKAFATWQAVANVTFVKVADSSTTDIRFGWDAIDGPLNQVGEAHWTSTPSAPNNTLETAEIRLDKSETWTLQSADLPFKSNFYSVVLHEIGHALGLDHSDNPSNIMYPEGHGPHDIGSGDITGIQTLYGARQNASVTDGADVFIATAGADNFNGAGGVDTVLFTGARASFNVSIITGSSAVVTGQGADALTNIERLQFSDGTLALDITGNAGEGYRIYKAAFDRTPDVAGLTYWIKSLDGGMSLSTVASNFIASAEFQKLYGASPTDAAFVEQLYENILDRAGEPSGVAFWQQALRNGMDRADVLANFAESAENVQATATLTHDGIWYV